MEKNECPCGSGKEYSRCCGIYISETATPETAEQLMRSRYTAFYNGEVEYLQKTLHSSKRTEESDKQYQEGVLNTQWLKLIILETEKGEGADTEGTVEFAAFYVDEEAGEIHEKSKFIKEDGRWFYLSGHFLPFVKQQRNAECLCGSGRKFKKCHGQ